MKLLLLTLLVIEDNIIVFVAESSKTVSLDTIMSRFQQEIMMNILQLPSILSVQLTPR